MWATKILLGKTVSGPVPVSKLRFSAACQFSNEDDVKLAEVVKKWWNIESYGTLLIAYKQAKVDKFNSASLNSTFKFHGDWYEVSLLWSGEQINFPTTFLQPRTNRCCMYRMTQFWTRINKAKWGECVARPVKFPVTQSTTCF